MLWHADFTSFFQASDSHREADNNVNMSLIVLNTDVNYHTMFLRCVKMTHPFLLRLSQGLPTRGFIRMGVTKHMIRAARVLTENTHLSSFPSVEVKPVYSLHTARRALASCVPVRPGSSGETRLRLGGMSTLPVGSEQ